MWACGREIHFFLFSVFTEKTPDQRVNAVLQCMVQLPDRGTLPPNWDCFELTKSQPMPDNQRRQPGELASGPPYHRTGGFLAITLAQDAEVSSPSRILDS